MRMLGCSLLVIGMLGVVLLTPRSAQANMARSYWAGQGHGPLLAPEATKIRVDDEELTFTVAPSLGSAEVVARYRMTNTGAASSDQVAFVYVHSDVERMEQAANESTAPRVLIDGAAAELTVVDGASLPAERRAAWGAISPERLRWLVFRLDFAAGQSRTVEVRYLHVAGSDMDARVNELALYDYLLSPAKSWASFGPLRVRVEVPPGTELVSSTIPLRPDGDTYRAELTGLPSGELSFSLMSTAGLWLGISSPSFYLALAVLLLCVLTLPLAWFGARSLRRSYPLRSSVRIVLGIFILILVVGVASTMAFSELAPRGAFGFGYGGSFFLILVHLAALFTGLVLSILAARGREKAVDAELEAYRLKNL